MYFLYFKVTFNFFFFSQIWCYVTSNFCIVLIELQVSLLDPCTARSSFETCAINPSDPMPSLPWNWYIRFFWFFSCDFEFIFHKNCFFRGNLILHIFEQNWIVNRSFTCFEKILLLEFGRTVVTLGWILVILTFSLQTLLENFLFLSYDSKCSQAIRLEGFLNCNTSRNI